MMSSSNPVWAALSFLLIFSFKLTSCISNNGVFCPEIEKQSLLKFKQSLEDPDNLLASWDGEVDCCKWKGVICNNITGNVHQLHLRGSYYTPFQMVNGKGLSGKINPYMLNLKHLEYLDLSQNKFNGEILPYFIGSLTNLEYLNLSYSGFEGKIPHNIGNLSKLHSLDLANLGVYVDRLEWLSGLSQLEYLNMNGANLGRATNWPQVMNALPSLQQLHFSACHLNTSMEVSLDNVNISTSLTHLDLSGNGNHFAIPSWFFQLSNLLSLDLRYNDFAGPIPTISNATKIQYIDLSVNELINSTIPDWLYFCKDLEYVSLSRNRLQGTLSTAIANLTSLTTLDLSGNKFSRIPREISNLCKIRKIDLSYNELEGEISDSFGDMSDCFLGSLEFLLLMSNNLSGHLTNQFGEFRSLRSLDLRNNSLSGAIPVSIRKLSSLVKLYIDDNMLTGIVTESHFSNLTRLMTLSASRNHITLNVSSDWTPPFQLKTLRIRSWVLGVSSQMPSWLEKLKNITQLDLSNTGITGRVPRWFRWNITYLDLSHNHLIGNIPEQVECLQTYLSYNKFSGPLPRMVSASELDLSHNSLSGSVSHFICGSFGVNILHLGHNQLSGELPDCWMGHSRLEYLNIGNNNISGGIPDSIGFLTDLKSLNLNGNRISGQIPSSMQNCTQLLKIDLDSNDLDGSIPTWMGTSLSLLRVLMLSSNKLSGKISLEICHLSYLQILDLSDNQFSGVIPKCFYNFTAMATKRSLEKDDYQVGGIAFLSHFSYSLDFKESASLSTKGTILKYKSFLSLVTNMDLSKNKLSGDIPKELTTLVELRFLNLSENHLTGLIPDNIGNMKELESLDFSRNSLSGQIPNSFTLLSSLAYLNLSNNNLSGRIPESTQLQSFNDSSFIGNNLCGLPLTRNCSHDDDGVHGQKEENEGDESEIKWVYVFLSLGYALGFSAVCTTLVLKKSWREAYFGFLQSMWDKCYVYVYIKWARFTRPSGATS